MSSLHEVWHSGDEEGRAARAAHFQTRDGTGPWVTYVADVRPPISDGVTVLIGGFNTTLPRMAASSNICPVAPYLVDEFIGFGFEWYSGVKVIAVRSDDVKEGKIRMASTKFGHEV